MNKFKEFLYKYKIVILILLLSIIVLQQCRSCSNKQAIAFDKRTHQVQVDSLNIIIKTQQDSIYDLNKQIAVLQGRNDLLNDANKSLKDANSRPIIIKEK